MGEGNAIKAMYSYCFIYFFILYLHPPPYIRFKKEMSKVTFSGNQIALRELKDQIIEIKNLKANSRADWSFDLIVKDATDPSKGFFPLVL